MRRSLINLWIVVHFGLWFVSLATAFGASPLLERFQELALPYLSPLHLRYDGQRIALAHGDIQDWGHEIQWRAGDRGAWKLMEYPRGLVMRDERLSRYARAIANATMVEDTPTAALLLMPLIEHLLGGRAAVESKGSPLAAGSGVMEQAHGMEFRVLALVPRQMQAAVLEELGGGSVVESARGDAAIERWRGVVVVDSEGTGTPSRLSVVRLRERRLSSFPEEPPTAAPLSGDSSMGAVKSQGEPE